MSEPQNLTEITAALATPFDLSEVKWKPAMVSGNRALALCYVDARVIQDRLDKVLGVTGWQDEYTVQADGSVVCRLRLRLGEEWITKTDVGGPSEQPDEGDRMKAAFSDALKRAAVKFGMGRYLYRLPSQWVDYDPQKKQITQTPQLPPWALPPGAQPQPKAQAKSRNGKEVTTAKLTVQQASDLRATAATLEREATDLSVMNAAMRQMQERRLPDGPFKNAMKKLFYEHAKNQGWTFDTEKEEFVCG